MSHESFDPSKYKNVAEMPKEEQENFVPVEEKGKSEAGFIRKEAKDKLVQAVEHAKAKNQNQSLVNRVTKVSETSLGVSHDYALNEKQYREEMGIKIDYIIREAFVRPHVSSEQLKASLGRALKDFREGVSWEGIDSSLVSREQEARILNEIESRRQQEDKNFEKFNPDVPKYKKVEDLPPERQVDFENAGDGFVRKTALSGDDVERAKTRAKNTNATRSLWDRIRGKNKLTTVDELQEEASWENDWRGRESKKIDEYIESEVTRSDVNSKYLSSLLEFFESQSRLPEGQRAKYVSTGAISEKQKSVLRAEIEKRKQQESLTPDGK